jgi:hypothetical protein
VSSSGGGRANPVIVEKNNLRELLQRPLTIPEYQRRYCWGKEQVELLLDDVKRLLDSAGSPPLFLGTLILHQDKAATNLRRNRPKIMISPVRKKILRSAPHSRFTRSRLKFVADKANLVDGQQRSLTLVLLLKALSDLKIKCEAPALTSLMQAQFPDSQSQQCLAANYQQIKAHLQTNSGFISKEKLQILLTKMEFVVITISSIDQAFAFFDSQNSSGKRLTDFDLLKARHLRGVVSSPSVGIGCSYIWEKYENQNVGNGQRLAYYLTEQILARTRMRQRNKRVDDLQLEREFPVYSHSQSTNNTPDSAIQLSPPTAVNFYRNWQVNYQPEAVDKFPFCFSTELSALNNSSLVFKVEDVTQLPLQLNQPLLGGEQLFFYIAKYTELYKRYFPLDVTDGNKKSVGKSLPIELHQQLLHLHRILEQGQSAGYSRLIEIWLALVVFYLDRFGEDPCFNEFVCTTDQYVFSLRITEGTLRRSTVENHFLENHVFDTLLQCPSSLQVLEEIKHQCEMQADVVKENSEVLAEIVKKKTGVIWRYLQSFYMPNSAEIKHHEHYETSLSTVMCEIVKS